MRRILIDPLSEPVQIALADGTDILKQTEAGAKDRAVALDDAFNALGDISDIHEIAVINGPGNFTAIRAGIGYARGLGMALGCKTRGISILEVDQKLAGFESIARDARRGRVYLLIGDTTTLITNSDIPQGVSSFDEIEGTSLFRASHTERMQAFANLAHRECGQIPASANYIRPADAAPSKIVPPRLLND